MAAELTARSRVHGIYRATVRLAQAFDASGGARTSRWRRLLGGSVAVDVLLWLALRSRSGLALVPRLALDAADTALWSFAPYPEGFYDLAVLTGVPLAVEAGLERGLGGLVVPAGNLAVTGLVRRRRGRPVQPAAFAWQAMAVAAGMGFARYNRLVSQQVEQDAARRRAADRARAFLAGQSDVALGADTIIDRLQLVSPILGPPLPGSALHRIHDSWRASLAAATSGRAVYLATALRTWERRHNLHPDLARLVDLRLPEGIGTKVLTGEQAAALGRLLDACDLRGTVTIALRSSEEGTRPPGAAFDLVAGPHTLAVPADPTRPARPPDIAPFTFLLGVLWLARTAAPTAEHVPMRTLVAPVLATVAASAWSEARLRERGPEAHAEIVGVALAIAGLHVTVATRAMRRPLTSLGVQQFPLYAGLTVPALLAGHYHDDLSGSARRGIGAATAGVCWLGWHLARRPRQLRAFVLNLTWVLTAYLPAVGVGAQFRAAAQDLATEMARQDEAVAGEAFAQGRAFVVNLAAAAFDEADERLAAASGTLDPALRAEARRRLEEVARRLHALRLAGSSSSTTTS